jgi:DNA-binding XRE family transcriptional regulator
MDDRDRNRLLHGPYAAPACRRGDVLACEYRGQDLRVGGLTDAPIPWPRALKTGVPSLIVCGDLARAVRSESELAIAHHWGVGLTTVWKWRQALGVDRMNEGTTRLYGDYRPEKIGAEAYAKMAETMRAPEMRERLAGPRRGKPAHPNTLAALLEAAKRPKTEAHRRAISEANRRRREMRSVTITTDHPSSNYGIPVILNDAGDPMDYAPGVKAVRARLGLSTTQLAEMCGKSRRTVEDWEQNRRNVPAEALNVMAMLLNRQGADKR